VLRQLVQTYTNIQLSALKGISQKKWDTLFRLFDNYGASPRLLFENLLPPDDSTDSVQDGRGVDDEKLQQRIAMYDDRLNGKILAALKLDPHIALAKEEYGIGCSHTIFTMRPCRMQQYKYVSIRPVYGLASPEIGRRIGQATTAISLNDARRMYEFLLQQGETKTSAGWIFEARMHLVFQRGGRFKATKLGGSATITIAISAERWQVFSNVSDLGGLLRKRLGRQKSMRMS
jgi:hypothetical protein